MQFHWKVLIWMLAGGLLGFGLQASLERPSWVGADFSSAEGALQFDGAAKGSPAAKSDLVPGQRIEAVIRNRGREAEPGESRDAAEQVHMLRTPEDFAAVLADCENGEVLWVVPVGAARGASGEVLDPISVGVSIDPDSPLASAIAPFAFVADIFLALLKMLIVPLVMSSIMTGVASVGSIKDLRRLGGKTFAYYVSTSLLAICVGQVLVNLIQPGNGAELGLSRNAAAWEGTDQNFIDILKRMVPDNVPAAMTSNGAMLQLIFFSLLFGFFITRAPGEHAERMRGVVQSFFEVMMKMAEWVLKTTLPIGVFALLVKVVASTGFGPFRFLFLYMLTVTIALVVHAGVTLPIVLKVVGKLSPMRWARAMSPALMTAFSTSSSSMTLPVTMKTVEDRGKVSNKVTSFTLPLGATINMDGTALYECIGVIFLAQYYASGTGPDAFELTLGKQAIVVLMALLASIGAAGIPSAGLVMMLTILSALQLPVEGAALLLAVDRPLDMMRTVVNVWSDSCGAAVIARSEGEEGPLLAET